MDAQQKTIAENCKDGAESGHDHLPGDRALAR